MWKNCDVNINNNKCLHGKATFGRVRVPIFPMWYIPCWMWSVWTRYNQFTNSPVQTWHMSADKQMTGPHKL